MVNGCVRGGEIHEENHRRLPRVPFDHAGIGDRDGRIVVENRADALCVLNHRARRVRARQVHEKLLVRLFDQVAVDRHRDCELHDTGGKREDARLGHVVRAGIRTDDRRAVGRGIADRDWHVAGPIQTDGEHGVFRASVSFGQGDVIDRHRHRVVVLNRADGADVLRGRVLDVRG